MQADVNMNTLSKRNAQDFHNSIEQPVNDLEARLLAAVYCHKLPLILGANFSIWRQQHDI